MIHSSDLDPEATEAEMAMDIFGPLTLEEVDAAIDSTIARWEADTVTAERPCISCGDPVEPPFRYCEDCAHEAAEDVPPWFLFDEE